MKNKQSGKDKEELFYSKFLNLGRKLGISNKKDNKKYASLKTYMKNV